jgi:hypothetical protein
MLVCLAQNALRDAYDERELVLDKIERGTPTRAPLEITCNAALLGSLAYTLAVAENGRKGF